MYSWEDVQSFCDDLSAWMVETDTVDQLKIAHPRGTFPLKADPAVDDEQESWSILVYLTLWVCLKLRSKAPSHLESRILLAEKISGPWVEFYVKLCKALEKGNVPESSGENMADDPIWNLAS